jgi:hypothetical protein
LHGKKSIRRMRTSKDKDTDMDNEKNKDEDQDRERGKRGGHLDKGCPGKLSQATSNLRLSHASGADHQDILGHHLFLERRLKLHAAPPARIDRSRQRPPNLTAPRAFRNFRGPKAEGRQAGGPREGRMAPVAHGDRNCTLGIGLANDMLVEVRDNLLGRHVVVELGFRGKNVFRGYVE